MDKKSKIIIAIIVTVLVALGAGGAYFATQLNTQNQSQTSQDVAQSSATPQQTDTKKESDAATVAYDGQDGRTALEILKGIKTVETKVYAGIGEMVVSIDGVKPEDSSEFWAFYVDGKQAQVGADQYVTKNKEKIEWKLEKIQ